MIQSNKFIFLVLSTVLLASCSKINEIEEKSVEPTGKDVITCKIEEPQTKSSLQNLVPVWSVGDKISVLSSAGTNSEFSLTEGQGTALGTFMGNLPISNTLYAIYPYADNNACSNGQLTFYKPQVQQGVTEDFPEGGNAMVASFTSTQLSPNFKNIFGVLQINLSGTARVGKITISSNHVNEMLWGKCVLTANAAMGTDSQTLTISEGSNETSIEFASPVQLSEGSARPFYFVLPAGALSTGFIINIYDGKNQLVYTKTTTKNQQITRSRIKSMETLEDVNQASGSDAVPDPTTWAAYNNLARTSDSDATVIDPQTSGYPQMKQGKYVGAFYFVWHTSNSSTGYGPFDVQKALGAGNYAFQDNYNYGCGDGKTHHWGEPYLGYYRDDDLWVLRKHAQMLADAGVDFLAFDVTNNAFYVNEITKLCNLYVEMRSEGYKTPQLTFMVWHSGPSSNPSPSERKDFNHDNAVTYLYNTFYTNQTYSDLWFKWEGKPLMMAIGDHVTNATIKNFFTFRQTWYLWNNNAQTSTDVGDPWYYGYGGTNDKWPWGVCYTDDTNNPMRVGTHNGVNEFCSVAPATHPVSNIGRSYPVNSGITYYAGANSYTKTPAKGIYFKSQFNAANALDPQIMFFTGWNEFLMGHFDPGALEFYWCGGARASYDMFIDQYNNEFSRDIEPIAGDFGDSYYYYMADYIRKFKGVNTLPTFAKRFSITVDGTFTDWNNVGSCYADDVCDTKWRGYDVGDGLYGWYAYGGTLSNYFNQTGRNDLKLSKVATDGTNVSFYIETVDNLTNYATASGNIGLKLLITSGTGTTWEGFRYLLEPTSSSVATLKVVSGSGYSWTTVSENIPIAVSGNKMEVSIPLSSIGISTPASFSLDFKWVDNVDLSQSDGIQRCMRDGDSAPNGRFRYRYVFQYAN